MKKFYKIKNDGMFKAIFSKEENKDILKRLIEEVINEEVEILKIQVPELLKNKAYIKGKTLDILVMTKTGEVNIELNSYADDFLRRRNAGYIFKRYSDSLNIGESYQKMPRFIQINLTTAPSSLPLFSLYKLYDKENDRYFIDNLEIYEINIKKTTELCYNEKKQSILGMLDMDYENLNNVKGDKIMNKLKNEALKLNSNDDFVKYLSDEDEERLLKNSFIEQGFEQGIEQTKITTAKKMLEKNIDIESISEITELSLDKIKELKKEI